MPIEDADKVHSKRGEESTISIFGRKISLVKFMVIAGGGIGAIFILIAIVMMMTPPPLPPIVPPTPTILSDTNITFDITTTNYNYRIIKLTSIGNKTMSIIQKEILLSMYPPQSSHYIQRQAIQNDDIITSPVNNTNLYIYTGIDNAFHISYNIPEYSKCVDFINGDWNLNIDNIATRYNMYKFNFNITNSKTKIIENGMFINEALKNISDYSTFFIYSGIYKERISLINSVRLIGMDNVIIDGGGLGADITIHSKNNVISGLTIINSGNKDLYDGGIVILPESTGNIITKNIIYKTIYGIWIYQSTSNTISNNTIRDNDKTGIVLLGSSSNIITNNIIYNNIDGIRADPLSDLNIIRENNVYNNKDYGIIITNYLNLKNICEYNLYNNNTMSCSDSIDRNKTTITTNNITIPVTTPVPVKTTSDDWWTDCKGNPKCYQS